MGVILISINAIHDFESALIELAGKHLNTVIPGYTHLQRAQPILLAHHLLAYFEMLERDINRFWDCMDRTNVLPLGSGALAGVAYDIDRGFVAKELGFDEISQNTSHGYQRNLYCGRLRNLILSSWTMLSPPVPALCRRKRTRTWQN
jgi:argininosuccinate lyase